MQEPNSDNEDLQTLEEIEPSARVELLSPRDILLGTRLDPKRVISTYSPEEYEDFVREWAAHGLLRKYALVRRASGPRDKGRDVLGFLTTDIASSQYDNFQCKRYDGALVPSDIWADLGKLLWYTFAGVYRRPRKYYFVAPKGLGPTLQQLLESPSDLKAALVSKWDDQCASQIRRGDPIYLKGPFDEYVRNFDLSIVAAVDPDELVAQHSTTRFHAARFGGGLARRRPDPPTVPSEVQAGELTYVRKLLDAYSEHLKESISNHSQLERTQQLARHFARQRESYYRAESLRNFERDNLPSDLGFQALMREIHSGVVDTCEEDHEDGYACVKAVTQAAMKLPITTYALVEHLAMDDKAGICHHLSNEDRLTWCKVVPERAE